jgi:hypothetical protein
MNERIRLLAEQAGISLSQKDFSYYWVESAEDIEKFAELIVLKCAEIAETAEPYQSADLIKQYFGNANDI